MAKLAGHKQKQVICEINITPLTDIFLVLLTIMMVVAPLMRQMRQDIKVPEIDSGSEVAKDQVTVEVDKDGKFYISQAEVSPETLGDILKRKAGETLEKKMVVEADRDAKSGAVLRVFRAAQEAGFEKMTVVGQGTNTVRRPEEKEPDETKPAGVVQ